MGDFAHGPGTYRRESSAIALFLEIVTLGGLGRHMWLSCSAVQTECPISVHSFLIINKDYLPRDSLAFGPAHGNNKSASVMLFED